VHISKATGVSLVATLRALVSGVIATATVSVAQGGNWQSAGSLGVPLWNYTFLSATPDGNLLAATIYSGQPEAPPKEIPALLVRHPMSSNPEVVELCRTTFDVNRGYGGIACDPSGSFFVSGDTGNSSTSFIRKFTSTGAPEPTFGKGGEIRPGRRCLGLEVFGEYLFCAMDWGRIGAFRTTTGESAGELPRATQEFYLRDVAMDPKSLRMFGVAEGGILTWGGGAPWQPANYQFRVLSPKVSRARAGEGISIDPIRRTVLISPIPGNVLNEVHGSGQIDKYEVTSAAPDTHLADSVMSFDGTMLFLSDARDRKIHAMRRSLSDMATPSAAVETVANATTGTVPPPKWFQSYEYTVRQAREAGQPMLVYFRKAEVNNCVQFENAVLRTDQFNVHTPGMACVFEDLARSPLLAYKFGVYRVPYVVILDKSGNQVAEYRHPIPPDTLFAAMRSAKQ